MTKTNKFLLQHACQLAHFWNRRPKQEARVRSVSLNPRVIMRRKIALATRLICFHISTSSRLSLFQIWNKGNSAHPLDPKQHVEWVTCSSPTLTLDQTTVWRSQLSRDRTVVNKQNDSKQAQFKTRKNNFQSNNKRKKQSKCRNPIGLRSYTIWILSHYSQHLHAFYFFLTPSTILQLWLSSARLAQNLTPITFSCTSH